MNLIVATSLNRVIGLNNKLPWHIPEDLKRFKQLTMGHTLLMGRKTFEAIGKPLPGRKNIVLTRDPNFHHNGVTVIHRFEDVGVRFIEPAQDQIFIIGGAQVYEQTLPHAKRIYLTLIHKEFSGDAYFPETDFEKEFKLIEKTDVFHSKNNHIPYQFITWERLNT